jgi:hypothetical protein
MDNLLVKAMSAGAFFAFPFQIFAGSQWTIFYGVNDDTNGWHDILCHIYFYLTCWLSNTSLIPNLTIAKGSKCHSCMQSKQPRKPPAVAEERNLISLELIHLDLCKINGVYSPMFTYCELNMKI